MLNRRSFLQQAALAAGALAWQQVAGETEADARLVILHTNDTHSRLDPFPMDGSRNQGLGGVAKRAALIDSIRAEGTPVLLLDAGDIFQGTPYFNLYQGKPEMQALDMMGYDAVTIGNHDFDGGLELLANRLSEVRFPLVVCNYDFTGTPMEGKSRPYKIFHRGKLKIGVTGVGIDPKGLVPDALAGKTTYGDPVQAVSAQAEWLKKTKGCDMVICLSHLGYDYKDNPSRISDKKLAESSSHVDLIIGGHTHTFLDAPTVIRNAEGKDVVVNQVGWAGIKLGKLEYDFSKKRNRKMVQSHTVVVGKKTSE